MGPFEAIGSVGTPLALAAFVVAAAAWVYRGKLAERRRLIESAPEDRRADLLAATIRDFSTVPVENLTKEQRYQLAVQLIQERASRFRLMALVSVIVAVLLAVVILLFKPQPAAATDLAVRLQGPEGPLARGTVTLDAGELRQRRDLDDDGVARFPDIPADAFTAGVTLAAQATGYRQAVATSLTAVPAGGAVVITLARDSTRVRGTVLDDPSNRRPLPGVILDFAGGAAVDTSDALGHFDVTLPATADGRVALRLQHDGRTGFDDAVTVAAGEGLVVYFEPGSPR